MKIKFVPNDIEVEIKPNESILKVAHDNGIHIKSVCKGVPSCAECRIQIADGEYNVFPPSPTEINLIGSAYFVDRSRLACQLKCFGNVTIDLKEQIEKASRNLASKRPRGSRAVMDGDDYDAGASAAIQGSIILDDKKVFEDIEEDQKQLEIQQQQRQQQNRSHGARQNQNRNAGASQRNKNHQNRPHQNKNDQSTRSQNNKPSYGPKSGSGNKSNS